MYAVSTGPFSAASTSSISEQYTKQTHQYGSTEGVETPAIVSLGVLHPNLEPLLHELEREESKEESSWISRHISFQTPFCAFFDV
jgi:hypothetical protein